MRYQSVMWLAMLLGSAQAAWLDDWEAAQSQAIVDWQQAGVEMATQIQQQCANAQDERLNGSQRAALQPAWQALVTQWGVVASQGAAVVDELGLGYRIAFWPDSRGIVARQMQTHQQERDAGTYQSLQLAGHGIQGLDWMLAQAQPDCVLLSDWAEMYQGYLTQIAAELPLTLTPADRALALAANDLYAQASRLNQRLREVIPAADGRYRPFMGDVSQTGQSLTWVAGGMVDLAQRMQRLTGAFPDDSQNAKAAELSAQLLDLAAELPAGWPVDDAKAAWVLSERIRAANVAVEHWLSDDVAQTYGLLIGFNNQDGD
ncbi:hypothetical protein [Saccharospirillum mangrovi]|uniref:hypothetical protein n=1 Tax=Saccharospirillum mangrovi TaxID=2161747 RepID=UPI000D3AF917|nr:hypothetical protein [Saccharospirillum mangrovi]